MQNNFNLRMGTPRLVNSQPWLMRPVANLNYFPNNFNNQTGYGYVQQYSAAGVNYRAPVYQNVHQHLSQEDYQQPYGTQLVNYMEIQDSAQLQNSQWSQSDYFQYLEERASRPQVHSESSHQPLSNQIDHSARFLQRTGAIAPPFIRQPKVTAHNKYNSNTFGSTSGGYRQQTQNRSQNAKVPRKQNQPMAMLPPPKPVHRRADQPVQNSTKKQKTCMGSRMETQQKAQTKPNQLKQNDNKTQPTQQSIITKKELYLHVGKVERDRALVGTIPQLFKWRSARHKFPPIYETVGTIDGRQNVIDKKQKIEDQFVVRNMKQWNTGSSMKELIECVVYSSVHRQAKFSVGTCVRIVGRYIPDSEMFHCLKIRQATESDLNRLTCIVKSLAARSVYVDSLSSIPMTSDENYKEPEESTNDVPPVSVAESDFLFQPY